MGRQVAELPPRKTELASVKAELTSLKAELASRKAELASLKAALASLCQESEYQKIRLIDCQIPTSHLESLGASLITRAEFVERINELTI